MNLKSQIFFIYRTRGSKIRVNMSLVWFDGKKKKSIMKLINEFELKLKLTF
jgi:hypothetical protein